MKISFSYEKDPPPKFQYEHEEKNNWLFFTGPILWKGQSEYIQMHIILSLYLRFDCDLIVLAVCEIVFNKHDIYHLRNKRKYECIPIIPISLDSQPSYNEIIRCMFVCLGSKQKSGKLRFLWHTHTHTHTFKYTNVKLIFANKEKKFIFLWSLALRGQSG